MDERDRAKKKMRLGLPSSGYECRPDGGRDFLDESQAFARGSTITTRVLWPARTKSRVGVGFRARQKRKRIKELAKVVSTNASNDSRGLMRGKQRACQPASPQALHRNTADWPRVSDSGIDQRSGSVMVLKQRGTEHRHKASAGP